MGEASGRIPPTLYDKLTKYLTFGLDTLWVARLIDEIELKKSAKVLDVATGTGIVAIAIAKRYKKYKIMAIDFDSEMINRAKEKSKGIKNIDYVVGNAEETTLPSNSFDIVTCSFSLGNFDQPGKAIAEMYRLLVPGGKIALLQMSKLRNKFIRSFYDIYYSVNVLPALDSRMKRNLEEYAETHPIEFNKRSVVRMLEDAGFSEIKVTELTLNLAFIVTARKLTK